MCHCAIGGFTAFTAVSAYCSQKTDGQLKLCGTYCLLPIYPFLVHMYKYTQASVFEVCENKSPDLSYEVATTDFFKECALSVEGG